MSETAAPAATETAAPVAAPEVNAAPAAPLSIGEAPAAEGLPAEVADGPAAGEAGPIAYEPTGDAGLDMALGFFGKIGLSPEHPAMAAAIGGDFGMLKAHLGALGAKAQGWEGFVALAEQSHSKHAAATAEKAAKDQAAVYAVVGGQEAWGEISKWAAANAEPAEKQAVNEALGKGGMVAKAMAAYLHGLYQKASGTVVEPAEVSKNGGRADPVGPLSAQAYNDAVQALVAQVGRGAIDGHPQYRALQARRIAGQRAGL